MKRLSTFLCLAPGSLLTLATPIDATTTSINDPSASGIYTKTVVDTTTHSRLIDHEAVQQKEVLNSGFSKAQSIIASAAERSPSSIPVPKQQRRAHHDPEALAEEPAYWTMILWINGYDVTIPVLRDNATDFCKSVSSEIESSRTSFVVSSTPLPPSSTEEPSTAPTATVTETVTSTSKEEDPDPTTTAEETTSEGTTDSPSLTVTSDPSKSSTKSQSQDPTSTAESEFPTETPTETSTPPEQSSPKTTAKTPSSTAITVTPSLSSPHHTTPSRTSVRKSSTSATEDLLTLDAATSDDSIGKSRDVSRIMEGNSKAWASYNSYIEGLKSRMGEQRTDGLAGTARESTEEPTSSVEEPAPTEAPRAIRQQNKVSQAARNVLPWLLSPLVWRRNFDIKLHDSSSVEKVQGWSDKPAAKKRQHEVEKVQGWTPNNKRQSPYRMNKAADKGRMSILNAAPPDSTTKNPSTKPTFGFDPDPKPRPHPTTTALNDNTVTPSQHKTSTKASPTSSLPTVFPSHPTTNPQLGDNTDSQPPTTPPDAPSHTNPSNATSPNTTSPGNATQTSDEASSAPRKWPNPFLAPIFWGVGAGYLMLAYWEGYQQARGEVTLGVGDTVCRWVGGMMVRHW